MGPILTNKPHGLKAQGASTLRTYRNPLLPV